MLGRLLGVPVLGAEDVFAGSGLPLFARGVVVAMADSIGPHDGELFGGSAGVLMTNAAE